MGYEKTYKTLDFLYRSIYDSGVRAYLVGGISAAIQSGSDLYRQNVDLDLMVNVDELEKLVQILSQHGYTVVDRRGIKTQNSVDANGRFHAANHELDTRSPNNELLGVGIFTYERQNGGITLNSYAYSEAEKCVLCHRKVIPEELFDLMYSSDKIDYHGTPVLCQSKAYTYMTKSRGTRDKDKLDAEHLEPYIDDNEKAKIARIKQLQKRVKVYTDKYNEKGELIYSEKTPELEDTLFLFVSNMAKSNPDISPTELYDMMLKNEKVQNIISERQDVADILEKLKTVGSATLEELAQNAKTICHLYCYSDDFEKEFVHQYGKPKDFISGLQEQVYSLKEQPETGVVKRNKEVKSKDEY